MADRHKTQKALFPAHESHTLVVDEVSQVFADADGRATWALDSFSLSVERPEIVGIVGPSGCGKSSLLRMLAGLDKPASGRITFDGAPVEGASHDRTLVFQDANLFDWLTVQKNIAFGLKARKTCKQDEWKVAELIGLMGLQGFESAYPSQISGGMASRCALARAFVQNPGMVLLDEPLAALDALTRNKLQEEIVSMQRMAKNIAILVTHDIEEAMFACDRIVVMSPRPGRKVAEVTVNMPHPRNRVSNEFVEARRAVLALLDEHEQTGEGQSIAQEVLNEPKGSRKR